MADYLTGLVTGLAVDAGLAFILYYLDKGNRTVANQIQKAEWCHLDKDLIEKLKELPDQTIPYGCIEGITASTSILRSKHVDDIQGVISRYKVIEYKAEIVNGIRRDFKNAICDYVADVPFYLHKVTKEGANNVRVHVKDPQCASDLFDELTVTYDKYESDPSGWIQALLKSIFGKVKRTYFYEKMLIVGTPLMGIGRIKLENDQIILAPPENGFRFILTTHTNAQSKIIKICLGITFVIGVGLTAFTVREWYKQRKMRTTCFICFNHIDGLIPSACGHFRVCDNCFRDFRFLIICPVCICRRRFPHPDVNLDQHRQTLRDVYEVMIKYKLTLALIRFYQNGWVSAQIT